MKKAIAVTMMLAFAGAAFASDPPKEADLVDYTWDSPVLMTITGELTDATPTFHRWRPGSFSDISLSCELLMTYEYSTDPHYDVYCFNVSDSAPVEFVVDVASFDTVIYIYCDPFDPLQSTVNGVFADDDDGAGLNSAIMASDGVTLTPGNDYWFLICSYSSTIGTYSVQTSSNVSLCGTSATEDSHWGSIKNLFR